MPSRSIAVGVAVALAASAAAAAPAAATQRRARAACKATPLPASFTPRAIGGDGTIVGAAFGHAAMLRHGHLLDLGTLERGGQSAANGIGPQGSIVGWATAEHGSTAHAVIWRHGRIADLGVLPGADNSAANAVNRFGHVVGSSGGLAVLWRSHGVIVDLGRPPGSNEAPESDALAINKHDEIVGWSVVDSPHTSHAILWRHGSARDLGALPGSDDPGGNDSQANAIAPDGSIYGSSTLSAVQGFLPAVPVQWLHGHLSRLPGLGPNGTTNGGAAKAVNRFDRVVGDADGRAVLWRHGRVVNLTKLLPRRSGWTLTDAIAINDATQIVGSGRYHGDARTFRADCRGL